MEDFSYVGVDDVSPLVKGGVTSEVSRKMLERKLVTLSAQLSGWFPGLRQIYTDLKAEVEAEKAAGNADAYSDLVGLVESMITEAGRSFITNPDRMSSETIGVFAYSRFEDTDLFDKHDLAALRALLEEAQQEQVGSFKIGMSATAYPAAPMPTPWTFSNSYSRNSWRR